MEIPMSAIPYPLEPLGICNPHFEIVAKLPNVTNTTNAFYGPNTTE